jgi:hypothetical protein
MLEVLDLKPQARISHLATVDPSLGDDSIRGCVDLQADQY